MNRPTFLKRGALGHLKAAGAYALEALRHLGLAARVVLGHAVAALVAIVVVFEEWGWRPLAAWLGRIARFKPIAALEVRVRRLPPYGALAVFALPSFLILPLKLVALVLIAGGHTLSAAALFIGAKIVGTALLARLFILTEAALMRIPWFKHGYDRLMPIKAALLVWVRDSTAWKMGRLVKARVKHALAPMLATVRARIGAWRTLLRGR